MAETTSGEGAWLRAAAAAEHLGISERTVRRQAIAGLLTGRRVRSARGHVWEVWIDGVAAPRPVTGRSRPDTAGHVRDADTARVDDLLDQVRHLRDQLAVRDEEIRRRDTIIVGLIQRLPELTAGRDASQTRTEANLTAAGHGAVPEPSRRPWWRFW